MAGSILKAAVNGWITWEIACTMLILMLLPILGFCTRLFLYRREPVKQIFTFYGIEAPLIFLLALRLFLFRELNAGVLVFLGFVGIGIVAFGVYVWRWVEAKKQSIEQRATHTSIQLIGLSIGLCVVLLMASILALYTFPIGLQLVGSFFSFRWLGMFRLGSLMALEHIFRSILISMVFFFGAILFVSFPAAISGLFVYAWHQTRQALAKLTNNRQSWVVTGIAIASTTGLFFYATQQPQTETFATLSTLPQTNRELRQRLAKKSMLRSGLLNAYLAGYRYLAPAGKSNSLRQTYMNATGCSKATAESIQTLHNFLLSPLIYDGASFRKDLQKAEKQYTAFFDAPIQMKERKAILHAIGSTMEWRRAASGVLDIGKRKVKLTNQSITLKEHGIWADVELHEEYENQTHQMQEVFYYFSLPEGAVVTGLWLSKPGGNQKTFRFTVAPRGAAQRVYKRQVRRRIDPALLEQVGPRQYRLRIFPIPAKPFPIRHGMNKLERQPAKHMHVWMSFRVLARKGYWPMPTLTQKRNVYWTHRTVRQTNGKKNATATKAWLPKQLPMRQTLTQTTYRQPLRNGGHITLTPINNRAPNMLSGKRIAVVLDRSYSMHRHRERVLRSFEWLKAHVVPHNAIELYLSSSPHRGTPMRVLPGIQKFNPKQTIYYGGHTLPGILDQFLKHKGSKQYDLVVVLTDEGNYELLKEKKKPKLVHTPLWIVHLGEHLAHAYSDSTLATIQASGGSVSQSVQDTFTRLSRLEATRSKTRLSLAGGYQWNYTPPAAQDKSQKATLSPSQQGFEALVAGQQIARLIYEKKATTLAGMDSIHKLAKTHQIVSPYSSMIVLVNQQQKDALKKESKRKDRFKRTVESGKTHISPPSSPLVTGTPEPHEWLLILMVLGGLAYSHRKKQLMRVA
jgi:putative PEP-CTERM system integral membrane protein